MEDKISGCPRISAVDKGKAPLIDNDKVHFIEGQNTVEEFQSSEQDALNLFATAVNSTVNVMKRGRGRPRKYGLDGVTKIGSWEPFRSTSLPPSPVSSTRKRVVDDGDYMNNAATNFTAHVLQVPKGKDVVKHIKSYGRKCGDSVCVLSASGAVNSMTIQYPATLKNLKLDKELYEILTLGGSLILCGKGSRSRKKNKLTVSFANGEGKVYGGIVTGPIIVAGPGPVQVVLGTFDQNIISTKKRNIAASSAGGSKSKPVSFNISSADMVQVVGIGDEDKDIVLQPEPISVVPAEAVDDDVVGGIGDENKDIALQPEPVSVVPAEAEAEADDAVVGGMGGENKDIALQPQPISVVPAEADNAVVGGAGTSNFNFTSPENLQTSPVSQPASSDEEEKKQPEPDQEITPNEMNLKD